MKGMFNKIMGVAVAILLTASLSYSSSDYYDSSGKEVFDGDTIKASDLNTINSAVDVGFQGVETDIEALQESSADWVLLTGSNDLDALTADGTYYWLTSSPTSAPVASVRGFMTNIVNGSYLYQVVQSGATADDQKMYSRFYNGSAWSSWVTLDQDGTAYEAVDATILRESDVSGTPTENATTVPISSHWAYGHVADSGDPHSAANYMQSLVEDTSPELGGNLTVTSRWINSGNDVNFRLGDSSGAEDLFLRDIGGNVVFRVNSDGDISTGSSGSLHMQDYVEILFGTDSDWLVQYDTAGDDHLSIKSDSSSDTTIKIVNAGTGSAILQVDGNEVLDTSDVDDTPVNNNVTSPISSNWAYDFENDIYLPRTNQPEILFANWKVTDDIYLLFGVTDDFAIGYDETTEDALVFSSNLGVDTSVIFKNNFAGNTNLFVDGDISYTMWKTPTNTFQYVEQDDGDLTIKLGATSSSKALKVLNSSGGILLSLAADGVLTSFGDINTVGGLFEQEGNVVLDIGDTDDTPVDGATASPISSNWAYDHYRNFVSHGNDWGTLTGTSATYSAIVGESYVVDRTVDITISLPTSGMSVGHKLEYILGTANDCTLDPGTGKLNGSTSDVVITGQYKRIELVYTGSTHGWVYRVSL